MVLHATVLTIDVYHTRALWTARALKHIHNTQLHQQENSKQGVLSRVLRGQRAEGLPGEPRTQQLVVLTCLGPMESGELLAVLMNLHLPALKLIQLLPNSSLVSWSETCPGLVRPPVIILGVGYFHILIKT